jgi:beta-glucosidase/6-phospho-beta-glucosidase/beta-galactosidase
MDVLVLASDFLWDTATAAHQAEARNRNTNWCVSKQAGLVPHCSSHAIGWVGSAH